MTGISPNAVSISDSYAAGRRPLGLMLMALLLLLFASRASNQLIPNDLAVLRACTRAWNVSFSKVIRGVVAGADERVQAIGLMGYGLKGSLPHSMGNLGSLRYLLLDNNSLSGSIPPSFSRLSNLQIMSMCNNSLSGSIPSGLGALQHLRTMVVTLNALSGTVPSSLGRLPAIQTLELHHNNLSGSLPPSLGSLQTLIAMDLSNNNFTGSIPPAYGNLTSLLFLNLANTSLSGPIPPSFARLLNAKQLQLPNSTVCPALTSPCPTSLYPSSAFCATCTSYCQQCITSSQPAIPPQPAPSSPSELSPGVRATAIVGSILIVSLLLVCMGFFCWRLKKKGFSKLKSLKSRDPSVKGTASQEPQPSTCKRFSFEELAAATDSWSHIAGSGAFGTVYLGKDPDNADVAWAVKRAMVVTHDFRKEVETMAGLRHPNLVRLLGFCVEANEATEVPEQVLVYEFIPNGDLRQRMKADEPMSFHQRLNILLGIARGLEYLHSNGIVHRDIKPANVLLDQSLQPKIADFGLLREVGVSTVHVTQVVGTPGYVDPAYVSSRRATPASDVYSFGVVMLELLTARPAVLEEDDSMHIKKWVEPLVLIGDAASFKDPLLDAPDDVLLKLAQVALSCMVVCTSDRPRMRSVSVELESIRAKLVGVDPNDHAGRVDKNVRRGISLSLSKELDELGVHV